MSTTRIQHPQEWYLLPIFGIKDGICECHRDCTSPGKHPQTRHGLKDATNNPDTIIRWTERTNSLAVRTGPESGLVVIDTDLSTGGLVTWQEVTSQHEPIETVTAITGGGGRHYYFQHPGVKVRNRVSILEGIDVRGDNGYVLLPGSSHLQGTYEWEDGKSPDDLPIAPLPEWLSTLLLKD